MGNDPDYWTTARDGTTPIHVRSWGVGLRQGILFGLLCGSILGAHVAVVVVLWLVA